MEIRYLTLDSASIDAQTIGTRAYCNSAAGREELERECTPEIVAQVLAVWGDTPTVEETPPALPPETPLPSSPIQRLEEENKLLRAQMAAQSDRADFIEDCIAEMAGQIYTV